MLLDRLYLGTLTVLILHQIDAAYWKEWEMFHLPGGIQGYLLFNILAIPIVLIGYGQILIKAKSARLYTNLCGFLGIITFFIHATFAAFGAEEFHLPLSIILISLSLILGVWLVIKASKIGAE